VLTGVVYVVSGFLTGHFRRHLLPSAEAASHYEPLQRLAYLVVVFALLPLIVLTGLAMSPAVTSVMPWLATMSGGHQSARTIHFFAAVAVTLFVIGHVTMVIVAGFAARVMAMITGGHETAQERV